MGDFSFQRYGSELVDSKLAFYSQNPLTPTSEILKTIYSCIDLTSLSNADNEASITKLVEQVNNHKKENPDVPNVAGICVYPSFVQLVKKLCTVPEVDIVSVAGGFPHAQTFLTIKTEEVKLAYNAGADEIDVVINAGDIIAGNKDKALYELQAMKEAAGAAKLKVILETGIYQYDSDIYDASIVALQAGANFIKTSTGKMSPAATPRAAVIMALALMDFKNKTGKDAGLKVAGGIRSVEEALTYYQILKDITGGERIDKYSFRIGATSLAGNVLKAIKSL
ncbi:MAG: deoxyribose-phosphate aldolase [Bacteroidales bacterium]|nr:deoxyribose-phosphate aldolase [Bacteroidales bacterium]